MEILITGGSGYLAWELVRQMKLRDGFEVIVASSDPAKIVADSNYSGVQLISNDEMWSNDSVMRHVDVIIHTAFCRKSNGEQLMKSLKFSQRLFEKAVCCGVNALINSSSQSVFGAKKGSLPAEEEFYAPDYMYALAKASSELLLETIADKSKTVYTNIRFASLMGPSKNVPINVLYKFLENALNEKDINIQGGKQNFSFLDVRDAADAVIRLLDFPFEEWKTAYNLGPQRQINIKELAQLARNYAAQRGRIVGEIFLKEGGTELNAGMDSRRIYEKINWKPQFSIEDTVAATGEYIIAIRELGGVARFDLCVVYAKKRWAA